MDSGAILDANKACETFGKCGSCKFWGPYMRNDGFGECRRNAWFSSAPLIKIENGREAVTEKDRTKLLFSVKFGCDYWESAMP